MSRDRVVELVRCGSRFLVACHRRPDADALGSALAWHAVLRQLDKEAVLYIPDEIPDSFSFLDGVSQVVPKLGDAAPFDATFVMDTAAASLLPEPFPPSELSGPVVVFDHHSAHDEFGDVVLRDVDAAATGEVILSLLPALGLAEVPPDAREPLYASLLADTAGFRYDRTTPRTLRWAADLVEGGVDPWHVAYHLFENWPRERMLLLSRVLETLELRLDGRLALMRVPRTLMEAVNATDEMVEGLVNYARRTSGVEVAGLVWERRTASGGITTQVSLRSRGPIDVSAIAVALGGGGHRAAAGATVESDLDTTLAVIQEEAAKLLGRA